MIMLLPNPKILFETNYFMLSIIYPVPGMIYRVLSAPCVYISVHYRNVQGPHGADDFGTGVPDARGTLSRQRFSPARTVTHYWSGGRRVEGQRQAGF